jgi:hypothetical protein
MFSEDAHTISLILAASACTLDKRGNEVPEYTAGRKYEYGKSKPPI